MVFNKYLNTHKRTSRMHDLRTQEPIDYTQRKRKKMYERQKKLQQQQ